MAYETINTETAVQIIEASPECTVTFRKKDSTEMRVMRCLPFGKSVNAGDKRNLLVYDLDKKGIRTIRKANIRFVQSVINTYTVKG